MLIIIIIHEMNLKNSFQQKPQILAKENKENLI
jgi:hypothetical protein